MQEYPVDPQMKHEFAERLLGWFAGHARDLPWRRHRTPYRVWVSEVMLQQTQVTTVEPYYERFLERFPTVEKLADASLEEVLKVWEGLGYYARARHLHRAAGQVVGSNGGRLPASFDEWRALPGVGTYTAGAIASIALDERVVAVDGNARRALCRVFGIRRDVTRSATKRELERLAAQLLPQREVGGFNEALIELGATVCTPRGPSCPRCPLGDLCWANAEGQQEGLPVRRRREQVPHYDVAAAVTIRDDGAVLVAQRNTDDMLGGLWEFPGGKRKDGESLPACLAREMCEELGVEVVVGEPLLVIPHAYTHFRITLHAFWCRLQDGEPRCLDCAAFRWVHPEDLEELPMSRVDRKVAWTLVGE
ncbi:MAG: A/G-specific adenine glycosylase [Chloroflexota bacterium]|nr:A/G-specific adenine glycosylase [Chloroflexota bacterium]